MAKRGQAYLYCGLTAVSMEGGPTGCLLLHRVGLSHSRKCPGVPSVVMATAPITPAANPAERRRVCP